MLLADSSNMAFTETETNFFIHHLFLPPKLPQADDHDPELDSALLRLVADAATTFADLVPQDQQPAVRLVSTAISQLSASRDANGAVDADGFLQTLKSLNTTALGEYSLQTPRSNHQVL